jgi:hypothetical protein
VRILLILKSFSYFKFGKYSAEWHHIYASRLRVGVRGQRATSLAGGFRARAGDFFALEVCRHPKVLLSGSLNARVQCTNRAGVPG